MPTVRQLDVVDIGYTMDERRNFLLHIRGREAATADDYQRLVLEKQALIPPLEDEDKYWNLTHAFGDPNTVRVEHFNHPFTITDFKRCREGGWLNDTVRLKMNNVVLC